MTKKNRLPAGLAAIVLALVLAACAQSTGPGQKVPAESLALDAGAPGWTTSGSLKFATYEASQIEDLSLDVTNVPAGTELVLVVTNADEGATRSLVGSLSNATAGARAAVIPRSSSEPASVRVVKDTPSSREFNSDPWRFVSKDPSLRAKSLGALAQSSAAKDTVGGSAASFWTTKIQGGEETETALSATCRAVVGPYHDVTLNVWVADESWAGGSKAIKVSQAMVDAVAGKFLKSGADDDIYEWITTLFGGDFSPAAGNPYFIADTNEITILIADLYEQDAQNGGVIGYFNGLHDYRKSVPGAARSNERVMFFLDAPMLANPLGGGNDAEWSASDDFAEESYSTLAHEFQHMIDFNEKVVAGGGGGSETWLDELCSAAAEDYVSAKLQIPGPRGVAWDDYSAGAAGNTGGRLPLFAYIPEDSLTIWGGGLADYSTVYAFSAWLSRNYRPGYLYREIVAYSGATGFDAVVDAVNTGTPGETRASLLRNWAVACLASSDTAAEQPHAMNKGAAFPQTVLGLSYALGSIDLQNYRYNDGGYQYDGLWIWNELPSASAPCSNTYVALQVSDGGASARIRLFPGMSVTVVAR